MAALDKLRIGQLSDWEGRTDVPPSQFVVGHIESEEWEGADAYEDDNIDRTIPMDSSLRVRIQRVLDTADISDNVSMYLCFAFHSYITDYLTAVYIPG